MVPASGFHRRLRVAMRAGALETAEELARKIPCSIKHAQDLLTSDTGGHVDVQTIVRIVDITGFSIRWLLYGCGSTSQRQEVTPDELWMLDALRLISIRDRAALAAAIAAMKSRA
jgi:hypothetical protein